MSDETVVVGVIGPARGLKGEVTLDVRTDNPEERFADGANFETTSKEFPTLTLEHLSYMKGRTYAYFEQVRTREDAESIRGASLIAQPLVEDDAWYPSELKGLLVVDPEGNELGTVRQLELGAAQDQLIVEHNGVGVRVPFVEEIVPEVNPVEGKIIVDAPGGLFAVEGD